MGHQRLGELPKTRDWRAVIALLADGGDASEVAQATALAAESDLLAAGEDPVLRHAYWLLTQIPLAARTDDFSTNLRGLGLPITGEPNLIEICTALSTAIDRRAATARSPDDFSELAGLAATESLCAISGREGPSLFGTTYAPEETRASLFRLANPQQFAVLARDFFARLVRRCLDYYLSRELPNHVGGGRRFAGLIDHQRFQVALEAHCRETSKIVEVFAGEWFSKTNFEGGIHQEDAGGFVHVVMKKLVSELIVRRRADA